MVLKYINDNGCIENSENFDRDNNLNKEALDNILKSLSVEEYIKLDVIERKVIELTDEGNGYAKNGSPEFQFVSNMQINVVTTMAQMEQKVGQQIAKIGFGKAMKQKWIKKEGNDFMRIAENPVDDDKTNLNKFLGDPTLESHDKKTVDQYKKRKHLNVKSIKSFKVTKGPNFATERVKLETELTAEMIRTKEW